MRTRPWPIVILALFHWLAPVANIAGPAMLLRIPFPAYLRLVMQEPWYLVLETVALFPIAGLAIFQMRRWSLPLVFAVLAWSFYRNFSTWQQMPQIYPLWLLITAYTVNVGIISYFLIPAVRAPYFNAALRWWETKPRFRVSWPCQVMAADGEGPVAQGEILDVAEGGVLLKSDALREIDQQTTQLRIKFGFVGREYNLQGKIVRRSIQPHMAYGFQFDGLPASDVRDVKRLLKALATMGVPLTRPQVDLMKDFANWWGLVFTNPRTAFVPSVPTRGPAPAAAPSDAKSADPKNDQAA